MLHTLQSFDEPRDEMREDLPLCSSGYSNQFNMPLLHLLPRILPGVIAAAALAGCAHKPAANGPEAGPSAAVDYSLVTPAVSQMYEAASNEVFALPRPHETNSAPVYPPELLPRRLSPVHLLAQVIVNEAGSPVEVIITSDENADPLFEQAIKDAVMTWRFTPLRRIKAAVSEPLPFSLQYQFSFVQNEGVPSVHRLGAN